MTSEFRLTLNQVALLFVPENPQLGICSPCVVQVIVKSIGFGSESTREGLDRSPSVDDCATFFCYADEISSAVESVVLGHLGSSSPGGIPANLILKGEKYILHASRKEWNGPGKDFSFKWGNQVVSAAPEKWVFEMVPMFEN